MNSIKEGDRPCSSTIQEDSRVTFENKTSLDWKCYLEHVSIDEFRNSNISKMNMEILGKTLDVFRQQPDRTARVQFLDWLVLSPNS